ncbi:uncharacterized protein EV422DRAFT_509548 [Fimicolochytrium jonesii]|uniref:uncharacterized protein n=1 Tax=Fimicolochytrium jonesii TaxID=1396493 RepID=UPI0022FE0E89|nr:uncharacterized protein EV422DRAFT_509548 [Fimicolochytrium jonesii]KAI8816700.1 hypothetical protein EV422DRAFT_509548 [Fimicolochytrium jonesii]
MTIAQAEHLEWKEEYDNLLANLSESADTNTAPWELLREIIKYKVSDNVRPDLGTPPPPATAQNPPDTVPDYVERIGRALDGFERTPFTIQRLCELVTRPSEGYGTVWKYLRALFSFLNRRKFARWEALSHIPRMATQMASPCMFKWSDVMLCIAPMDISTSTVTLAVSEPAVSAEPASQEVEAEPVTNGVTNGIGNEGPISASSAIPMDIVD